MKKLLLVSSLLALSAVSAFADLKDDAYRIADAITRDGWRLSPAQISQVDTKFREINQILYGNSVNASYACVSKDNDNMPPFVFALRKGVNVQRIVGTTYTTADACNVALSSRRLIGALDIACISKDNDGQNPWLFGSLDGNGGIRRIKESISKTFEDCRTLLNRIVIRFNYASYCTSKDNDGASPYVAAALDLVTGVVQKGNEYYSDAESCWDFVGQN